MPFASSSDLLSWLNQNLFLNPQQVEELRPFTGNLPDLHAFCKEMLRRDWLTAFQVNQILKDNADSLIIGANRLMARLGEGSMGQVYRAWNVRLGRMVAVKMLHAEHMLSNKAMERFRREMQTAAQLDHPNIVLLRDADEVNQCPYLVMDFIDGIDLSRKVKQGGPIPIHEAVEYCRQAAAGLQHALERGIVHRDIKPSNLLVTRGSDGATVVKILDFGLAKFEREGDGQKALTQLGRLLGTVDYIAPEQAEDAHRADVRADIFSLGCTLYYLITGTAPFTGNDHMEKLLARIQGIAPRLSVRRPDIPMGLDDVVFKMMARLPQDRYQTPNEVMHALTPFSREAPPSLPVGLPAMEISRPAAPVLATPVLGSPVVASPVALPANPVAAPIALATPLGAAAPMAAYPATVAAPAESEGDFPFGQPYRTSPADAEAVSPGFNGHASPTMTPAGPAAAMRPPASEEAEKPRGRGPLLLLVAGGGLVLLGLVIGFLFLRGGPAGIFHKGTIELSLDSPPTKWYWGQRKPIIVVVKRKDFTGPVTVQFENMPAGVQCQPITMTKDKDELRLIYSFQSPPFEGNMRLVASAPNAQSAILEMPISLINAAEPAPKLPMPIPEEKKAIEG